MDNIGPNVRNGSGITEWTNDAATNINRKQVIHSNDIALTKTPAGIKLTIKDRHKGLYEDPYKGEFTASRHYDVGDVMRVIDGVDYGVPAAVGTWKCVVNIPDKYISDSRSAAGVYPPAATKYYYIRDGSVTYYPVSPEPDDLAVITDDPATMIDGRFWELMGGTGGGSSGSVLPLWL